MSENTALGVTQISDAKENIPNLSKPVKSQGPSYQLQNEQKAFVLQPGKIHSNIRQSKRHYKLKHFSLDTAITEEAEAAESDRKTPKTFNC